MQEFRKNFVINSFTEQFPCLRKLFYVNQFYRERDSLKLVKYNISQDDYTIKHVGVFRLLLKLHGLSFFIFFYTSVLFYSTFTAKLTSYRSVKTFISNILHTLPITSYLGYVAVVNNSTLYTNAFTKPFR